jgi:restriction system protein
MILKYDEYYVPVLEYLATNGPTATRKIRNDVATATGITDEERSLKTEKGTLIWDSRIYWAIAFLFQSGALDRPERAIYGISELGRRLLKENPVSLDESILRETEGYKRWVERMETKRNSHQCSIQTGAGEAPQESIEASIAEIDNQLAAELISQIQNMPPDFLEKCVLRLLGAMGYGIDDTSLQHTGKSGDEGIDGIINQDRLGLQRIYIQAKRYKTGSDIGREQIQTFMGALAGQGASGGVFITTSAFKQSAREYVSKTMTSKIVLIDGVELGHLLVQYEIGVVVKKLHKVMELDENFFADES